MTTQDYGILTAEHIASMSGREVLQAIIDGRLPQPPIAKTLSFNLVEVGDGFAAFECDPGVHVLNSVGVVHGGWALTLIDSAAGCACLSLLPAGAAYTTIETKANFSRPILPDTGRVRAEARVVSHGRRIMSCQGQVLAPDGKILAHGTSTIMVLSDRPKSSAPVSG